MCLALNADVISPIKYFVFDVDDVIVVVNVVDVVVVVVVVDHDLLVCLSDRSACPMSNSFCSTRIESK